MSTWEERMSAAAKAREDAARVERRAEFDANDPHAGHHVHWAGGGSQCSCGEFLGIASFVLPRSYGWPVIGRLMPHWDRWRIRCWLCGKRGVAGPVGGDQR